MSRSGGGAVVERRNRWDAKTAGLLFGTTIFAVAVNAFWIGFGVGMVRGGKYANLVCPGVLFFGLLVPVGYAFARNALRLFAWPFRRTEWTLGAGELAVRSRLFGVAGGAARHDLARVAHVDIRKEPSSPRSDGYHDDFWGQFRPPPRADAPYAVVLAGAGGAAVLRMDRLTEVEAQWLAAEVRRVVAANAGGRAAAPR